MEKDPRKAEDGILAVIPEDALVKDKEGKLISLRASIRDNFKAIKQSLDTTKQAAISEIKQQSESNLAKDLAELSKAYEAGLLANKERHEKQAAEAFSQQITALKDLIIKQLEEAIKKSKPTKRLKSTLYRCISVRQMRFKLRRSLKGRTTGLKGFGSRLSRLNLKRAK